MPRGWHPPAPSFVVALAPKGREHRPTDPELNVRKVREARPPYWHRLRHPTLYRIKPRSGNSSSGGISSAPALGHRRLSPPRKRPPHLPTLASFGWRAIHGDTPCRRLEHGSSVLQTSPRRPKIQRGR